MAWETKKFLSFSPDETATRNLGDIQRLDDEYRPP